MAENSKKPLPAWIIRKALDEKISPIPARQNIAGPVLFLVFSLIFFIWRLYA